MTGIENNQNIIDIPTQDIDSKLSKLELGENSNFDNLARLEELCFEKTNSPENIEITTEYLKNLKNLLSQEVARMGFSLDNISKENIS